MSEKKLFVLDTNILLSDPNSIFSFEENDVIIPMVVLEELDHHKSRQDEVGQNARTVSRTLDDMRSKGSLLQGVTLPSGGTLKIVTISNQNVVLPIELQTKDHNVDNMIIAFMLQLKKNPLTDKEAILVSKDINVRLKCDALGILCNDYLKMRIGNDTKKFYRGVEEVEVPEALIDQFFCTGEVTLPSDLLADKRLYPNQFVILTNTQGGMTTKSAITKCISPDKPLTKLSKKIEAAYGLKQRNKEQGFSLDLLFDENVKLLTLIGPSGSGKTLLAIAAALAQLRTFGEEQRYDRVIITRPVQPLGRDIGFLPGTINEKMEPWIAPIRDNINFLMNNQKVSVAAKKTSADEYYLSLMQEKGLIEIEAITFIRGRSIPNSFMIIDEAQNLSMHELKTIITRVGDNTKIVLTGDIEQIDNVHVDAYTNGLSYAVERFKEYPIAGHVTLTKGERSVLATLASKIL